MYLGHGWRFLTDFRYLSVYYAIPWVVMPAVALLLADRSSRETTTPRCGMNQISSSASKERARKMVEEYEFRMNLRKGTPACALSSLGSACRPMTILVPKEMR